MIRISVPYTISRRKLRGTAGLIAFGLCDNCISKLTADSVEVLPTSAKLCRLQKEGTAGEAAMASIPFASYSASKVHQHMKDKFHYNTEETSGESTGKTFRQNIFGIDQILTNYNSKLMNSIWGQYNLYAAHAFQKNNEGSYSGFDFLNVPQIKDMWDILRTAH